MGNSIRFSENPEMMPSQMVFVPDEIAADGRTVSDVTMTESDFEMTDIEMEVRTFISLVIMNVLKKCKSKSDYGEMTTITLAHQLMIGIMKDYPITEWVFPILSSKKVAAQVYNELYEKTHHHLKRMLRFENPAEKFRKA
ncbi:unnamed protein product [Pleuronectes platessa]|uniref:Uncharacterized protein n=1 Tax=Pleuronectes platessa TaxID=8262 RepID=A0A9N7W148_PLEPL|nr:unnamed protein product [Pleuronectes platessa]CAB1458925.1 unnamed protein product [Pleuronectes platessa]